MLLVWLITAVVIESDNPRTVILRVVLACLLSDVANILMRLQGK